MATFQVTAEHLVVNPHPDTDAVELAQIGLYRAAVPPGRYRTGDVAVYLPEGALLPERLIDELGLRGRLAGPERNRVKAVRVHGQLCQGLVCRPSALTDADLAAAAEQRRDLSALLGVTKWTPPVPPPLAGTVEPAPDLLPWPEIESLRRYPSLFTEGEPVVVTEKIHGSACLVSYLAHAGSAYVSSKGFGARRTAIRASATNLYWRAIRAFGVIEFAAEVARRCAAARVGVFGEVYGRGIQDLSYGTDATARPGFALLDIAVDLGGEVRWLDPAEVLVIGNGRVPMAPLLYAGPYDVPLMLALAEGEETVSGRAVHLREGVVVRPEVGRVSAVTAGRAIGKLLSEAYLVRNGATEYV